MPSGWAHGFYWVTLSTVVPPPVVSKGGGYPIWQASSISVAGSLLGGLQALWERLHTWAKLLRRLLKWSPETVTQALDRWESPVPPKVVVQHVHTYVKLKPKKRPRVEKLLKWARLASRAPVVIERTPLTEAERLMGHPAYPFAQDAVRKTATTLGFHRPEAWQGLSRNMKAEPGRAENVFRHLEACRITRETCGSTLTNPDCNLLVELAYHDFAIKGR